MCDDQLVDDLRHRGSRTARPGPDLGHYSVANAGGFTATGWGVSVGRPVASHVRGSDRVPHVVGASGPAWPDTEALVRHAPSAVRGADERLHDVVTPSRCRGAADLDARARHLSAQLALLAGSPRRDRSGAGSALRRPALSGPAVRSRAGRGGSSSSPSAILFRELRRTKSGPSTTICWSSDRPSASSAASPFSSEPSLEACLPGPGAARGDLRTPGTPA